MNLRRRTAIIALAAPVLLGPISVSQPSGSVAGTASESAPPATIPALRTWTPKAPAGFTLDATPRVVVDSVAHRPTGRIIAEDLTAATGVSHTVGVGEATAGNIALVLSGEESLGPEGYRLEVGHVARVIAPTDAGLFYGGQSLVQLLRQALTIPAGRAVDWPRYHERGYMLDLGRHHFDLAFLRRQVDEMAYLKLNLLHLHLSDNIGFRIESSRHPEITSPEHLSKAEVRRLVSYAAARHVTVVPEIDMPGHMGAILAEHPELQLANAAGVKDPSRLDVTNPAAVAFANDIISEFLPLFPGRYWHLGADEYMPAAEYPAHPALAVHATRRYGPGAVGKDAVLGFVNGMAAFLGARGKTVRVWNDDLGGGSAVEPDRRLVVEWWTGFSPLGGDPVPPPPQQLLDEGHAVLNNGWWPTYDTQVGLPPPDMAVAYDEWWVHRFHSSLYASSTIKPPPYLVKPDEPRNLGTKLALWMDTDRSNADVQASVLPRLRVIAQKAWESPQLPTYEQFLALGEDISTAP
jgi:hexosaminidase